MKKGYVRITNIVIHDALKFPVEWVIERIEPGKRLGESLMLVSGPDFPETNNRGEAEEVQIIVHKEAMKFEVKKI